MSPILADDETPTKKVVRTMESQGLKHAPLSAYDIAKSWSRGWQFSEADFRNGLVVRVIEQMGRFPHSEQRAARGGQSIFA